MALQTLSLNDLEHRVNYPIVNFFDKASMRLLKFRDLEKLQSGDEILIELGSINGKKSFLVEVLLDAAGVINDETCIALCGELRAKKSDPRSLLLTWDLYFESKDSGSLAVRKY